MGYLLSIVTSAIGGFTTICTKTYMTRTRHVKSNVDLYMLFIYPLMTLYYFLLAGGEVPLNWPTLWFSVAYAVVGLLSTELNMKAYNHATIVYITVFSGASMILPFFYEVFFLHNDFSLYQYISVGLRILAVSVPLLFAGKEESITKKGFFLCILLFLVGGIGGVIMRMFSTHPNVTSDGSFFFWINVVTMPTAVLNIFRKSKPAQLYADSKQIKFYYFLLMLLAAVINNGINFISVELIRQITSTVYSILTGSVRICVLAFLSVVIYKEKLTLQAAVSLLFSLGAMILSLL